MDVKFNFKTTQRGPVHDACRGAVLFPIVKRANLKKGESRDSLAARYHVLQRIWRVRAAVLCEKGWEKLRGLRLQYMRNCPPFSTTGFTNVLRPCHLSRICPMCYARLVTAEAFRCVEFSIYMGRPKPMPGFRILALKRSWKFPGSQALGPLLQSMVRDRRHEVDKIPQRGAVILTHVEPVPGSWKITRSSIVIVKDDVDVDTGQFEGVQVRRAEKTTKGQLSSMVAWATKYPTGLLFGEDERAVELMTASWNQQMFTTSGLMRNKNYRELLV